MTQLLKEGTIADGQNRESSIQNRGSEVCDGQPHAQLATHVCLLTGGSDKPYALGMAEALTAAGISVDFIGSNELSVPELLNNGRVNFLNFRGDQSSDAALLTKVLRVGRFYGRLLFYAGTARPKLFHILWNNKFEFFDRTFLMLYYKLVGKRIVLTAHNVNIRRRDGRDSWLNRFSLKVQYKLADHIFVHSEKMKKELTAEFDVIDGKVSVIPFGINNTIPNSEITAFDAKRMLGIQNSDKTLLCFGQIAPYKGFEYLVAAFTELLKKDGHYRLVIAGKPKWNENYWRKIKERILENGVGDRVIQRIEHVPDEEAEIFFKGADVLVLPYTNIFQSGVIFLAYSFGLPVIATDVGSLKEEVLEGETGFICRPRDSSDLARQIEAYFQSDLSKDLGNKREQIKKFANERYSWSKVVTITAGRYGDLLTC